MSEAGVEGKIIAWRDVLHEGPVDSSLPLEELSKQRARFIASHNWDDFAHISGDFEERDRVIRHLDYSDEVVLWFEDDLYDQLQLVQILEFFARGPERGKTQSLIVVEGYIPPRSEAEIKKIDAKRPRVTPLMPELSNRSWLRVTPLGRDVLAGKKDWQQINQRTRWLGGVEIRPGADGWRWDPTESQLVKGRPTSLSAKPTGGKKKRVAKKSAGVANPRRPSRGKK